MGIYDREYYQERPPGLQLGGQRMLVTNLVLLNAAIFLVDIVFLSDGNGLSKFLSLKSDQWQVWQLLTYGFAHDPKNIWHILGNMFVLWYFGRDIEATDGKQSFLFFYFTALIISGIVGGYLEGYFSPVAIHLMGASGGTTAVLIVFVCRYPRRTLLLWPFGIPIPAWLLGAFIVVSDFLGTFADTNVAHSAHLAGAAYGYAFFRTRWSLGRLLPGGFSLGGIKPRPKFRIHDPDADEQKLTAEMDRILEKIHSEGEDSLTRKERRTLEAASRHFKQRG